MTLDDDPSVIYGLDYQARCLSCVQAEQDKVQFLVGTQTLKFENQVCRLDLEEDSNQVAKHNFAHKAGEIWNLASSPLDPNIIATCYSTVIENRLLNGCTVWKLDENSQPDSSSYDLESISSFSHLTDNQSVSCFEWRPASSSADRALVLYGSRISLVDTNFQSDSMQIISQSQVEGKSVCKVINGKWNPHHNSNTFAVLADGNVKGYDMRTMKPSFQIENAHIPLIRDLDFNPNRQYILATSGDDCRIKFWDIRQTDKPLTVISQHSHWVWCVRYNPIHDQLLLSCSSDSRLALHCVASISSEPNTLNEHDQGHNEDDETPNSPPADALEDGVLRIYDEHEESVYSCDWSISDPWIFASLSYDGRVIIGRVPKRVKYTILQL